MDNEYSRCNSLKEADIHANGEIGAYAFWHCDSLESVIIGEGIQHVGYRAFYECASLKEIVFESSTTSSAKGNDRRMAASTTQTTIGKQAFANCTELATAVLSDQVTSIGDEAFLNDSKLRIIYLLSTTPPTLGTDWIKGVADDCVIYVPEGAEDDYKTAGLSGYDVQGCDPTGVKTVDGVADQDSVVSVYGLNGKCVYRGKQSGMSLRPGLYVVKSATSTRKVVVR